tara:strand:+ start:7119 stop:7445 length:327 start_codon:yes stop_codon:yes gene_type:complete
MKGSTCIAFIVLVLAVMPAAVFAEDKFDLGDLVELISLLPHIYDGIVGFIAIWNSDGLGAALTVVAVFMSVMFVLIELFKPCLQEASKKKYQPVRTVANIWTAGDRQR